MIVDNASPAPSSSPKGLTRGISLAIAVAIFLVIVVAATGNFCVEVLLQGSIDGAILAAWLLAAFGYGRLVVRRIIDTPAGLRCVSEIALGLGITGLIEAGLGFAGLLSAATVWAIIGVGVVAALAALRERTFGELRPWLAARSPAASVAWLWAAPIAIGFVAASMAPGFLWKPLDPHPYDVLSYHLQIPREWYDAGRIVPLRHNSFSFFPMGMETHFLTAMHLRGGPWAAMYLCQFISLAHGVLTALAVTAVCRSMRVGPVVSNLAGIATLAVPWTLMLSSVCYVESGVMLYTLLAVAWATRATTASVDSGATGRGNPRPVQDREPAQVSEYRDLWHPAVEMALAGAFAGFVCGMKYTAVAMTAVPLLILWPVLAGRALGMRRTVLAWLAGAVACGLVFSPWLVRNAVTTGNPVFPLATKIFGPRHFTPDQIDRYQTAHSPPPAERPLTARLDVAWQRVMTDPQYGYVLLPAVVAAMTLAIIRRLRDVAFLGLMLGSMAAIWLCATHLLTRFLSPVIPLATVFVIVTLNRATRVGPWKGWVAGAVRLGVRQLAKVFEHSVPGVRITVQMMFGRSTRLGPWVSGIVCACQAVVGLAWTWTTLAAALPLGRQGLFRMSDMTMLETAETQAARQSGQKVALIGDAQAFFYVVPSDRLLYRGVFDVVVPPGANTVDAWHGRSVEDLRRDGYWVVINTSELDRLSKTYTHLPKPVAPFDVITPTPIVLPPLK